MRTSEQSRASGARRRPDPFDLVFFGFVLALAAWYVVRNLGCALDDSYITYQYAANAAEGHGLVFDVGQQSFGSTAMGEAVLLAGLGRALSVGLGLLPLDPSRTTPRALIPAIALVASALSLVAIALVWHRIGRFLAFRRGTLLLLLIVPTAYLFSGFPSNFVAGHETCLFVALLLIGSCLAFFEDRWIAAGLATGLSTLVRPDAALFACVLLAMVAAAWALGSRRPSDPRAGLQFGAAYLALVAPWSLFLWATFGSPIPGTLAAKRAQVLLGNLAPFTLGRALAPLREHLPVSLVVLLLATAGVGLLRARPPSRTRLGHALSQPAVAFSLAWVAFSVGLVAAYCLFHVTFWRWYVYPVYYAALGLVIPAAALINGAVRTTAWRIGLVVLLLAVFLAADAAPFGVMTREWVSHRNHNDHTAINEPIARFLRETEPEGAVVATPEPGNLAYRLGPRFHVIDMVGLTSPEVSRAILAGDRYYAVREEKPDYVIDSWRLATNPAPLPWFTRAYERVGEFRNPYWALYLDRGVYLYARRGRASRKVIPPNQSLSEALPGGVPGLGPGGVGVRCAVEMVQDAHVLAPATTGVPAGELLRLNGWAVDTARGRSPDRVILRLHHASRNYYAEAPIRIRRDDLVEYFRDPAFGESGWQATIDVSNALPGTYDLDFVLVSGDVAKRCGSLQKIEVLAASSTRDVQAGAPPAGSVGPP